MTKKKDENMKETENFKDLQSEFVKVRQLRAPASLFLYHYEEAVFLRK